MAAIPLSQSPTIKEIRLLLAQAVARIAALEAGGGGTTPEARTIYNTLAGTDLRVNEVQGFEFFANNIDARLTALGY